VVVVVATLPHSALPQPLGNSFTQLVLVPPTVASMLHVGGRAPPILHVIWHWVAHWLLKLETVVTVPTPPPKMVSTTSAATSITTAVTTIRMDVDSAFIE